MNIFFTKFYVKILNFAQWFYEILRKLQIFTKSALNNHHCIFLSILLANVFFKFLMRLIKNWKISIEYLSSVSKWIASLSFVVVCKQNISDIIFAYKVYQIITSIINFLCS